MKAKGIPDKIYLQVCGSCEQKYCDTCEFEKLEDNITWSKDKIFPNDVEYTRTDAFIDKVCEWLLNNGYDYYDGEYFQCDSNIVNDFKKYMEE